MKKNFLWNKSYFIKYVIRRNNVIINHEIKDGNDITDVILSIDKKSFLRFKNKLLDEINYIDFFQGLIKLIKCRNLKR